MPNIWIIAKYDAACNECETHINAGDKVLFDTHARVIYCEECAEDLDDDSTIEDKD
jgi:hypothetical protein